MPMVTIVYWRDIPAQVIVGSGRRAAKVQLSERFEQAIDRCAMRSGAQDTDAYLAQWRKAPPYEAGAPGDSDDQAIAQSEADRIEHLYDRTRLIALIEAEGWDQSSKEARPET